MLMNDEQLKKYLTMEPQQAVAEFNKDEHIGKPPKVKSGALVTGRTYVTPTVEARISRYEQEYANRMDALSKSVFFIHPNFCEDFLLTRGLILVGAMSGKSKSTTSANLLHGFVEYSNPNRVAKVISNEESSESVLNRIACIKLKQNFNRFQRGQLKDKESEQVVKTAKAIIPRVEIVDDDNYDMTCIEDVQAVLNQAAEDPNTGLVVIDYLQTIAHSREQKSMESFKVSKLMGLYLKDYGKRIGVPVVVFCQLNPSGRDSTVFQSRVQNDKTIYNHAFSVIEIVPDMETKITKFTIHKDRFGNKQGQEVRMRYVDGRYVLEDEV